jgi:type IV secretory pathway VirB10-like protein
MAFLEEYASAHSLHEQTTLALAASEGLMARLKSSVGRLYGHFNNVMLKWGIVATNTYGREACADIPFENGGESEPSASRPPLYPLPQKKSRPLYQFDQQKQKLVPAAAAAASSPPPPPPSVTEKKPATPTSKTPVAAAVPERRRRSSSKFTRKNAPEKEELLWRRELTEKQLKLRPSTIRDVLARLAADGFPVTFPYYAEKVRNKSSRLVTVVSADLYLLVHNGAAKREGNLYSWVADRPDRYKSRPH